jgi:hypothetical protein
MHQLPRHNQRGWNGVELTISFGVIFAVMGMLIWVIVPMDRYRDARNVRRREESYAILNAVLLKEKDDVEPYRGEAPARLDRDGTTAQIIVRRVGNDTCTHGLATTPTCPGAVKAGLRLVETGHDCLVTLDDDRYNKVGLVTRYLLSMPIDPSRFLPSVTHQIQGPPLSSGNSGYYINRGELGNLEVGACQPELGQLIREVR